MEKIAKALIKAQSQMGNALKDSINPFFKSKYADLNSVREACLPLLNANGIAVIQPIIYDNGKSFVKTILVHESGETIESITEVVCSKQNDAQSYGSALTYARRYGLQSLVNIGAEDDDGNKASNPVVKETPVKESNPKTLEEYKAIVNNATHVLSAEDKIKWLNDCENWDLKRLQANLLKLGQLIKKREDMIHTENEKQKQNNN